LLAEPNDTGAQAVEAAGPNESNDLRKSYLKQYFYTITPTASGNSFKALNKHFNGPANAGLVTIPLLAIDILQKLNKHVRMFNVRQNRNMNQHACPPRCSAIIKVEGGSVN
jgi:hypothetical protein